MNERVLIVEDEPIIAEDLSVIVTKAGYKVVGIANDGLTAMDKLRALDVDIALLDISLEGQITGIDIAQVINDKYQIPFIFITSYVDDITLEKAQSVLPSGYIVKPFKKKDILANIQISLFKSRQEKKSTYLSLDALNQNLAKPISDREYELLLDVAKGFSNLELSNKHFVTINTIKTHLKRIFVKLNVANRAQAVARMVRQE